MPHDKTDVIARPIVPVGGELALSDKIESTELDMEGFVPPSDDQDESDTIPIYIEGVNESDFIDIQTETMTLHYKPLPKRKPWSIFDELKPSAVEATRRAGETLERFGEIDGPGWRRLSIPQHRLPAIIDRLRRREREIVESRHVEIMLEQAQALWKTNSPLKWEQAKYLRIKALTAPFEAARVSYEAAKLEAALRSGRPVPGGLLDIELKGRTAWAIPDVHGNDWGWWMMWNTPLQGGPPLIERIREGDVVIDMGDVSHPDFAPYDHWSPSAIILQDLFDKALRYPDHFWFEPGNHETFYGGGEDAFTKGEISQGIVFRNYLIERYGVAFARTAQAIVDASPFFARFWAGDEVIAAVAHSPVTYGGMTPEDATILPFDPILRRQVTWNRPFDYENIKAYTPKDLMDSRRKIASPYTIFAGGHSGHPKKASYYQPDDMPGHVIGQATAHFNDELAVLKITPEFVGVVNVAGDTELAGRNLREEFIDSLKPKRRFLKLLRLDSDEEPTGTDVATPFKKHGRKGPFSYKQDPVDLSRVMGERKAAKGDGEERNAEMISKGFWFGSTSDTPLIIDADGERFQIVGIFGSSVEADADEVMGATDELIVEKKGAGNGQPLRALLRDGPNYIGPLRIFKDGKHLRIDTGAEKGSGIASVSTLYLRKTEDGGARLTVHDPGSFAMRPTEIPEPTRVSKSTAVPPPIPKEKTEFAGIARATVPSRPGATFPEPAYPLEIGALACSGALERSMPGIDAVTYSAMLAVPYLKV